MLKYAYKREIPPFIKDFLHIIVQWYRIKNKTKVKKIYILALTFTLVSYKIISKLILPVNIVAGDVKSWLWSAKQAKLPKGDRDLH